MTHPWYERSGFSYYNGKASYDNNSDVVAMYNLLKKSSDDDFGTYIKDLVDTIIEEKGELNDVAMMQAILSDNALKIARKNAIAVKAALIDYFGYQTERSMSEDKLPALGLIDFMKKHNVDDKIIDKLDNNVEKTMKAKIVTKKFNSYDRSLGLSYIDRKNNETMNFVVFEFNVGSEKIDMFTSLLPSVSKKTQLEQIIYTDKEGNTSNVYNFILSLNAKYDAAKNSNKDLNRVEQYIHFDDKTMPFKTFGNVNFWRTKKKEQLNFVENIGTNGFVEGRGRLLTMSEVNAFYGDNYVISDVYNYTGYTNKLPNAGNEAAVVALFNKLTSKDPNASTLSGRPFILVSYDKTMKKDDLMNHFQRQLVDYVQAEQEQRERRVKDKVRLIPLDTDGVPFDSWLKMMYSAVVKSKTAEKGKGYKLLNGIGGDFMAARLCASIYDIADTYNNYVKSPKAGKEGYNKFRGVFGLNPDITNNAEVDKIGTVANNIIDVMDLMMSSHFDNERGSFLKALKQGIEETAHRHKGDKTARKERILISIQNSINKFNPDKAGEFEIEGQTLNMDYSMDVFIYSLKAAIFGGVHKVGSSSITFTPTDIVGFDFARKPADEKINILSCLNEPLKNDYPYGIFFHPIYTHEGDRSDNVNAWAIKADKMDDLVHPITGEKVQMYLLNLDIQPPKLMIPLGDVELMSEEELQEKKEEQLLEDITVVQTELNDIVTTINTVVTMTDELTQLGSDCGITFDEITDTIDNNEVTEEYVDDKHSELDSLKRRLTKALSNTVINVENEYLHLYIDSDGEILGTNISNILREKFNKLDIESKSFEKNGESIVTTIVGKTESGSERIYLTTSLLL